MTVYTQVLPRPAIRRVWRQLAEGIDHYRTKTPHFIPTTKEVLTYLVQDDGDEVFVATVGGEYGGFLTFKVQEFEGEVWGTIAIIFLTKHAQEHGALPEITKQLEQLLRERGCTVMNYITARKGFQRLAPRLGFRARITEWMKEL